MAICHNTGYGLVTCQDNVPQEVATVITMVLLFTRTGLYDVCSVAMVQVSCLAAVDSLWGDAIEMYSVYNQVEPS